jgi:hypothetical protein
VLVGPVAVDSVVVAEAWRLQLLVPEQPQIEQLPRKRYFAVAVAVVAGIDSLLLSGCYYH